MADNSETTHHLFMVRIWTDGAGSAPSVRRGLIEHVPTGERRYFVDLGEMQAFVSGHLAGTAGTTEEDAHAP